MNALFDKGAHPRPSLFEESSVHLKISKPSVKPKIKTTTKEFKGTTIKKENIEKTKSNKAKQNFQTYVGQSGHGSESFLLLVFSMVLIAFALTSLVVLVSLVFPMVLDVLKLLHCMFKRVPGNN